MVILPWWRVKNHQKKTNPSPSSQNVNMPKNTGMPAEGSWRRKFGLTKLGVGFCFGSCWVITKPMDKNKMRTKSIVPKCVQTAYSRDFISFGLVLLVAFWASCDTPLPPVKKQNVPLQKCSPELQMKYWKKYLKLHRYLHFSFIKTEGIGVLHLNFSISPWKTPQVHLCLQPEFLGKNYGSNPSNSTVALFRMQNEEQQTRVPWCYRALGFWISFW